MTPPARASDVIVIAPPASERSRQDHRLVSIHETGLLR
jgi:hypothetical protein